MNNDEMKTMKILKKKLTIADENEWRAWTDEKWLMKKQWRKRWNNGNGCISWRTMKKYLWNDIGQ